MRGCFAFNRDGLRCDSPAGHDGPHTLTIEWDDEEVWTPLAAPAPGLSVVPTVVPVRTGARKCAICSHRFHQGVCGAPDGDGFDCDCAAGVEE